MVSRNMQIIKTDKDSKYAFLSNSWDTYSIRKKKRLIEKEIVIASKKLHIPTPKILYKPMHITNAEALYDDYCIVFNIDLLKDENHYKYLIDNGNTVLSTIYHELNHLRQYIYKPKPSINLGTENEIVIVKYNNQIYKSKLYISTPQNNEFLYSIYVLQPNEYESFEIGQEIISSINPFSKSSDFTKIKHAIAFLNKYFGKRNFPQEIEAALLNLYDNGTRKCSEEIMDLVTRCAICSYQDKEDYGTDKISIFLGENYENSLKEKIQNQYDDYSLDC